MQRITGKLLSVIFLWLISTIAQAETVYVIDKLSIGLHQERSINSPIVKLVPTGTALTVIERADDLVQVREPDGTQGWVNSKYIMTDKPGRAHVTELENANKKLQQEIELLKTKVVTADDTATTANGSNTEKELEQKLNSERLKVGNLQAQLTDLKARIADIDNSDKFLADIEKLKNENSQLIAQLESSGVEVQTETGAMSHDSFSFNNWKQMLIIFAVILLIGMAGGAFLLDYINRRRHGGFRV